MCLHAAPRVPCIVCSSYCSCTPFVPHHYTFCLPYCAACPADVPTKNFVQVHTMKSEALAHVRSVCINQVLGTDMKKHFDITSRFQVGFSPKSYSMSIGLLLLHTVCALCYRTLFWLLAPTRTVFNIVASFKIRLLKAGGNSVQTIWHLSVRRQLSCSGCVFAICFV